MTLSFAAGFDGRILLQSVRHAEQKDGIMSADTCSLIENVRKIAQNISVLCQPSHDILANVSAMSERG